MRFIPERVLFEKDALEYPLGQKLYRRFRREGITVQMTASHNRVTGIPGKTPQEAYFEAKRTLVVGVRRTLKFAPCKPSAHYQLPLNTSCSGKCEYCYLNTTLGKKPYIRVYVNIEEIFSAAAKYIEERAPQITVFEGAATSDPIPAEHYTGVLKEAVSFFGRQDYGRFRFVTKFTDIDSLLDAPHNGHTRFRFSINAEEIIRRFEHATPPLAERLAAAKKVALAGYPLGFLVAPLMAIDNWQEDYRALFAAAAAELGGAAPDLTFEFVTHRFTKRAKSNILDVFPNTLLDMNEEARTFKFGQFVYGKYVYPKKTLAEMKEFFAGLAGEFFPQAKVEYFV